MGDLSYHTFYGLFQEELKVELSFLQNGLVNARRGIRMDESVDEMLLSTSAIYGAARLVDLNDIEKMTNTMTSYFKGIRWENFSIEDAHFDIILDCVKKLLSLYVCEKEKVNEWVSSNSQEIKSLTDDLSVIISREKSKNLEEESFEGEEVEEKVPKDEGEETGVMWELFCDELKNQSRVMESALLILEQNPNELKNFEECMRAAHSIKGAARIVRLDAIIDLAHTCEDCFVFFQEEGRALPAEKINLLLQSLDRFLNLSCISEENLEVWLQENEEELDFLKLNIASKDPISNEELEVKFLKNKQASTLSDDFVEEKKETEKEFEDYPLKIATKTVNTIIALSGEEYVASHGLGVFVGDLQKLKRYQFQISSMGEELRQKIIDGAEKEDLLELLQEIQKVDLLLKDLLAEKSEELNNFSHQSLNLSDRLYRTALACRMSSFSEGVSDFPRMLRDLAVELKKKVCLRVIGKMVQVDKDILEKLKSPIGHLLRNAIAHGIESPEERVKKGKPQEATIYLEAKHDRGLLVIKIMDDGRGMDLEKLCRVLEKKGIIERGKASSLTEQEIYDLACRSGVSTQEKVSEIAGRGVGLDVVHKMVCDVGGELHIQSEKGKGVVCTLELPLSLSVLSALVVEVSEELYAFPLFRIDRLITVSYDDLIEEDDRYFMEFLDKKTPIVYARDILDLEEKGEVDKEEIPILMISDRFRSYGVIVDRILGKRELVVRDLEEQIGKVKDISAGAMMDDGTPLLIIDVNDVLESEKLKV